LAIDKNRKWIKPCGRAVLPGVFFFFLNILGLQVATGRSPFVQPTQARRSLFRAKRNVSIVRSSACVEGGIREWK
jgi:hypothetical protein